MKIIPKKEYIKLIILVIIFIGLAFGTTYAFLSLSDSKNNPTGQAGCFDIDYSVTGFPNNSSTSIIHTNLSSTTNYLEGVKATVSLKKASTCKIYTEASLYIHTQNLTELRSTTSATTLLPTGAVNYTITNSSGTVLTEGSITALGRKLMSDSLEITANTASTYNIYLWIDSSITSNRNFDEKEFVGYIYAESTQQSTIEN